MIKKIKSRLSVKVFFITLLLMVLCCTITYSCIVRFSPYIYTYKLSDAEDFTNAFSVELSHTPFDEAKYIITAFEELFANEYDDEFIIHIFKNSGEEINLSDFDNLSGGHIDNYKNEETTSKYKITLADSTDEYILFLTKNRNKESQVIEALQKSLPFLSVVIIVTSIFAAFFYTWYITSPVKKVSNISKQMADMDFSGLCPTKRTDEIGVLSQSLNRLSENLSAALSELQKANKKLQDDIDMERKLEQQRLEFFSAASHELKTPITIIKGQLQGMLYQVGRYKDRETYLAKSLETTEALEIMVQELLTISRIDSPEYNCQKNNFNLSKLINNCFSDYEDLFVQKDLTVQKDIQQNISTAGDIQLLKKVFNNLLSNAAAYSEAGNYITASLRQETDNIIFTIENTGAHIPDDDIPKLFEAFYRVEQSRNRKTGGTGLGLYIVKTILDLHNAEIKISNTANGVAVKIKF
ncbi:MAG: HAMP domain-containing histidine kinase [Eubacterium sp.]|nr:HAMP domain-containing histidine kinase [Eubacterium sp.]